MCGRGFEVAILIGLQASGKTTFYRTRLAATHAHVSKDLFPRVRNRDARQRQEIEAALAAGRSVAVDNTNPTPADRAKIVAIARAHAARIVGYYFDATVRDALSRNRQRSGPARVPDVAIFTTAKRLVPPTPEEGFDELFRVVALDNGRFDLKPVSNSML